MSVSEKRHRTGKRRHGHEYGQSWMLAAALLDGPKTIENLEEYYRIMGRRFGFFTDIWGRKLQKDPYTGKSHLRINLERTLQILLRREWAVYRDRVYHITPEGRKQAENMLNDLKRGGRIFDKATQPETVSMVTLAVHFLLAAIKFPAALLSGSVGLLNDSLDTLMDGFSSLFVYFGVRYEQERLASYVLLLFMSLTGIYTLYEALSRIYHPEILNRDWTVFVAVAVSALICAVLWIYQKYSGLKHKCVPLIAQSVDSRNHILVAGGVAAGLVAAFFDFILLDQLVGLAVAVLILKGAIELLIDLIKSKGEEHVDLSRYEFTGMNRHRHEQTVLWLLFEIYNGQIKTAEDLEIRAREATDFTSIAAFKSLGLDQQQNREENIKSAIRELYEKKLIKPVKSFKPSPIRLSPWGLAELDKGLSKAPGVSLTSPGVKNRFLRFAFFLIRFAFSAVLYAGIYALGRWILGWLPVLDLWAIQIVNFPDLHIGPYHPGAVQFLFMCFGLCLFYSGRMFLHRARHAIHHARERRSRPVFLVTDGPYAKRRHPMYAGMILINISIGVGLHSVYSLLYSAFVFVILIISTLYEERQLQVWFGSRYSTYMQNVNQKYFPIGVWIYVSILYIASWLGVLKS